MISRRFLMWSVCRNIYHKLEFSPVYKWGSEVEILRLGAISETNRWAACISVLAIAFSDYAIINWGTARRHHLDCFSSQILSRITTWHKTPLDVLLARPHHPDQSIYTMLVPIFAKKMYFFNGRREIKKKGSFFMHEIAKFWRRSNEKYDVQRKMSSVWNSYSHFHKKGFFISHNDKEKHCAEKGKGVGGGGGAARSTLLQLHLHYRLNIWLQWSGQRQPQDKTRNI